MSQQETYKGYTITRIPDSYPIVGGKYTVSMEGEKFRGEEALKTTGHYNSIQAAKRHIDEITGSEGSFWKEQ